jgi:hypothetical protein
VEDCSRASSQRLKQGTDEAVGATGQAIRAHGGPTRVAAVLGWDTAAQKKPRGYWDDIENLQVEIDTFIEEAGLPPRQMPAKTEFVRAGRYDLARAIERWGGVQDVADALEYQIVGPCCSIYGPSPSPLPALTRSC